jgi:hypothetical protein
MPRARKPHKCGECLRTIEPGEIYEKTVGIHEGDFDTYITCEQCVSVRDWLQKVCGGWIYSMVEEDIAEHFREGYGIWLGRAAVSMRRKWRRRDGSLMGPMTLPEKLPVGVF